MVSAPAAANASMKGSAGAIIRCTSSTFLVWGRIAFTTPGPMLMLGTKCPSMTSTCTQSQPAASMARTSSPSRAKSAERIDGAIRMSLVIGTPASPLLACGERVGARGNSSAWLPLALANSLPHAPRPGLATFGSALQEVEHGARHVGARGLLHALDAGRGVHLQHQRP